VTETPRPLFVTALGYIGVGYLSFCVAMLVFTLVTHTPQGALTAVGTALLIPLLGLSLGPLVGLMSTAPYFSAAFKLELLVALVAAAGLFGVGLRFRRALWGKLLALGSVWLWILAGLFGLGPQ
jgi:hypothetical protein